MNYGECGESGEEGWGIWGNVLQITPLGDVVCIFEKASGEVVGESSASGG